VLEKANFPAYSLQNRTKEALREHSGHMKEITAVLGNDKRYLILNCAKAERESLLKTFIDEMHRKGPPPPPTASEPSRRGLK